MSPNCFHSIINVLKTAHSDTRGKSFEFAIFGFRFTFGHSIDVPVLARNCLCGQ